MEYSPLQIAVRAYFEEFAENLRQFLISEGIGDHDVLTDITTDVIEFLRETMRDEEVPTDEQIRVADLQVQLRSYRKAHSENDPGFSFSEEEREYLVEFVEAQLDPAKPMPNPERMFEISRRLQDEYGPEDGPDSPAPQ